MKNILNLKKFGFIGFGLIGGSVAHAIREIYPQADIMAYNYYITKPHPRLNKALSDGVLSQITTELADFSECDAIFLCAPVKTNIEYLNKLVPHISPDCMLTDVGSVKGDIVSAVRKAGLTRQFIGGHPMTGSEKIGYEYSTSDFFIKKYYVLTPMADTKPEYIEWMKQFVHNVGSHCIILDPAKHDAVVAGISHVPHVISASLVNSVAALDQDDTYGLLAAGGFHSVTRISSSSPEMWQNICESNQEEILTFLDRFMENISDFRNKIEQQDSDALLHLFADAKEYRDHILQLEKQGNTRE